MFYHLRPMSEFAPLVLALTSPLGSPCSVQCLDACICICIGQALAEPLGDSYTRLVQVLLVTSNSVHVWCLQVGWIPRLGSLWRSFLSDSAPYFVPVFPFDRRNSGLIFFRRVAISLNQELCLYTGYGLYRFCLHFVGYFS